MLGYYFDCIDGPMARKYNMVTVFGDYYDHGTDIICFTLVNYYYFTLYNFSFSNFRFDNAFYIFNYYVCNIRNEY